MDRLLPEKSEYYSAFLWLVEVAVLVLEFDFVDGSKPLVVEDLFVIGWSKLESLIATTVGAVVVVVIEHCLKQHVEFVAVASFVVRLVVAVVEPVVLVLPPR